MIDSRQKGSIMDQIHKHFAVDQVKILMQTYIQGNTKQSENEMQTGTLSLGEGID
jgi:hypothetical protein